MPPKPSEVYRRLLQEGWQDTGDGKGSHRKLRKGSALIILPFHAKEINKGTWNSIKKKAG